MTNSDERSPPAVGVYWINEGDYPALLNIFPDGNRMPRTWAEWLKIAEEMESGLKAYGHVVMRVPIDPNTFRDWCARGNRKAAVSIRGRRARWRDARLGAKCRDINPTLRPRRRRAMRRAQSASSRRWRRPTAWQ